MGCLPLKPCKLWAGVVLRLSLSRARDVAKATSDLSRDGIHLATLVSCEPTHMPRLLPSCCPSAAHSSSSPRWGTAYSKGTA